MGYGGKRCPSTIINSDCNIGFCPQDCVYGYYREWSTCSVSCGSVGVMTRRRSITTMDANNGVPCNETVLEQQKACNLGPCPTRCKLSDWGDWGSCQKQVGSSFQQVSCGGGNKTRTRFVLNPGTDGQTCPERSETVPCNEHPCPIDCELNDWTVSADTDSNGWTECTKTCGGGSQSRARTVKIQRQYGGEECGDPVEQRSCSRTPCAVDCVVSDPNWNETANEWSECSVSCGGGLKFKHRSIMRSANPQCARTRPARRTVRSRIGTAGHNAPSAAVVVRRPNAATSRMPDPSVEKTVRNFLNGAHAGSNLAAKSLITSTIWTRVHTSRAVPWHVTTGTTTT